MSLLSKRPATLVAVAGLAGAVVAAAAIYGTGGFERKPGGHCATTVARAATLKPVMTGEVAALVPASQSIDLTELAFTGADGTPKTIRDWAGRIVLLNLWATWCAPCKAEMPDLDKLQAAKGSGDFEVVTVSIDTSGPEKRKKFLAEAGVATLKDHTDPSLGIFKALQGVGLSRGMPTTVLIDRNGCELAAINGPAPWHHTDALRLIDAAIALPKEAAK